MDTPIPATAPRDGQIQRYFSTVLADPGKYTVKFAVVDEARRGSVELLVDARLTPAGPIRATDLLLADGLGRTGTLPLAPAVSGELVGNAIHSYLELFADEAATLEDTSVTLEIAESETSQALERIPMTLATPRKALAAGLLPRRRISRGSRPAGTSRAP